MLGKTNGGGGWRPSLGDVLSDERFDELLDLLHVLQPFSPAPEVMDALSWPHGAFSVRKISKIFREEHEVEDAYLG
jgi:hypothetical protein